MLAGYKNHYSVFIIQIFILYHYLRFNIWALSLKKHHRVSCWYTDQNTMAAFLVFHFWFCHNYKNNDYNFDPSKWVHIELGSKTSHTIFLLWLIRTQLFEVGATVVGEVGISKVRLSLENWEAALCFCLYSNWSDGVTPGGVQHLLLVGFLNFLIPILQ